MQKLWNKIKSLGIHSPWKVIILSRRPDTCAHTVNDCYDFFFFKWVTVASEYPPKCCTYSANSVVKCLVPRETLPIRRTFCVHPTTNLQLLFFCFVRSHICRVRVYLDVTCYLTHLSVTLKRFFSLPCFLFPAAVFIFWKKEKKKKEEDRFLGVVGFFYLPPLFGCLTN